MGRRPLAALAAPLALVTLSAFSAAAAEVSGKVSIRTRGEHGALVEKADASNVVVYITGLTEPAPDSLAKMVQKDKRFLPAVLPIVAGQAVEFPNEDVRIHNVFSKSRARTFDLGKYRKGDRSKTVVFEQTGVVEVYCDIHEEMAATILVLPNTKFAVTGNDGRFTLPSLPPGKYTVFAWQRRGEPARQSLVVKEGGENVSLSFALEETRLGETHLNKYGQKYKPRSEGY